MPKTASLPDLGPAPELTNDTWLNVDSPLRIADLQGKVVIVEMWIFVFPPPCIGCRNRKRLHMINPATAAIPTSPPPHASGHKSPR